MTARHPKMVTLNVSGHLFTLPESDILRYPYSKLADVASYTLADDVASLNVPADSFAVLAHYLSTCTLPPPPLPLTVESTFKTLGIPYPSSLVIDQHTASIGASGSIREWEARLPFSPDVSSSTSERREALRLIESGLLTGRPEPPSHPIRGDSYSELPAYSDISPSHDAVDSKNNIIPTILRSLAPSGMSIVVLIPSDVRTLAAIERPSWDTGTGAGNDEEVLSFPETKQHMKKVLRLPKSGGYTWDVVFADEFQLGLRSDLLHELESESALKRKQGISSGAAGPDILVWPEEEVVLKHVSPMGLNETRSGKAIIVQVWR